MTSRSPGMREAGAHAESTGERLRQAREQASAATGQARLAGQEAVRTLGYIGADSVYAMLGATRYGLAAGRTVTRFGLEMPRQVVGLTVEVPEMVRALRDQSRANARWASSRWVDRFDELASRGREFAGAVREIEPVREAGEQFRESGLEAGDAARELAGAVGQAAGATGRVLERIERQTQPGRIIDLREEEGREQRGAEPDYSAMTLEELRDRARDAQIEGRSQMNKDDLVKALRRQERASSRQAGGRRGAPREDFEELTVEELRDRAREAQVEGRSQMNKDELVRALQHQ